MPIPVSVTASTTASPSRSSATVIPPVNVNFSALDSRLSTTFAHISRSTNTGSASGGQRTVSSSPACSTAGRNSSASSAV